MITASAESKSNQRINGIRITNLVLLAVMICLVAVGAAAQNLVDYSKPASHFPYFVSPYLAHQVPAPSFGNTPRIETLLKDGKLRLSLSDAVVLALENNLDLAIARFNLSIADTDILRAKSGESVRGVATGVVQGTPGGGVGGFGSGAPGAGAGGTTGGAGGAGGGASGLVQSTLGIGTNIDSFDPMVIRRHEHRACDLPAIEHRFWRAYRLCSRTPASPILTTRRALASGTLLRVDFNNDRITNNSLFSILSPEVDSSFPLFPSPASAGRFWLWAQPALHSHCAQ